MHHYTVAPDHTSDLILLREGMPHTRLLEEACISHWYYY